MDAGAGRSLQATDPRYLRSGGQPLARDRAPVGRRHHRPRPDPRRPWPRLRRNAERADPRPAAVRRVQDVSVSFPIQDTFEITGRGVVILIKGLVEEPEGYSLHARVRTPDGSIVEAQAYREIIMRLQPEPHEREGFLLAGIAKEAIPIGSEVEFE